MRNAIRAGVCAALLSAILNPALALPTPFYSASVEGAAHASGVGGLCGLGFDQSYRTYPLGVGLDHAQGQADAVNACDPLAGSTARSGADLATGKLHVLSASSRYEPGVQFYSLASASFSDDVFLYFGNQAVSSLAPGLFGEIRLDMDGTRSSQLSGSRAYLDVRGPQGAVVGYAEDTDVFNGDSLAIAFNTSIHFQSFLSASTADGQIADFSNTGALSIVLPQGYSFRSSSGVLLTDLGTVAAVPEPATSALVLAGLGLCAIAGARRRRRDLAALARHANAGVTPA